MKTVKLLSQQAWDLQTARKDKTGFIDFNYNKQITNSFEWLEGRLHYIFMVACHEEKITCIVNPLISKFVKVAPFQEIK
jgi:hypothetical protein